MSDRDALDPELVKQRRETAELLQKVRLEEMQGEIDQGKERTRMTFEQWESIFGRKVRDLRTGRGWSQEELAQRMTDLGFDMHQTTVAKLEKGARPLRVSEAIALAQVFGVPALSVFYGPGPDEEPWSLSRMREHLGVIEEGLQRSEEELRARANDVAYYETSRAHLAKAMLEAAKRADAGELTEEE